MYSTINKSSYLELRLFILIIVSIIIIISDGKFNMFLPFRNRIEDSIYLFYHLCHKPIYMFNYVSRMLSGYTTLILENDALHKELFLKNSELLLLDHYKQENYKLHDLLHSPICQMHSKLITKIFFINTDACVEQAIINRGIDKGGVYIGQPVVSDVGVVGQIIRVNHISSRVLLISDQAHALSVKLQHNNARMILVGRGYHVDLYAEYAGDVDIHINDILVTSGLDDRFPEGYPVAIVSNIKKNLTKDTTIIQAKPIVNLKCLRYVILIKSNATN